MIELQDGKATESLLQCSVRPVGVTGEAESEGKTVLERGQLEMADLLPWFSMNTDLKFHLFIVTDSFSIYFSLDPHITL